MARFNGQRCLIVERFDRRLHASGGYWLRLPTVSSAIDGHAKNFSLFINPGGRFQLTPLYNVLSAWPVIASRMLLTARRLGLADAATTLDGLITQTPAVVAAVRAQVPAGFPEGVAEPVLSGLEASARQLQRQRIGAASCN